MMNRNLRRMVSTMTPRELHKLSGAIGQDAANFRMRDAGRTKWNRADANLAATTMQQMYREFNLLNADTFMPEGYEWAEDGTGNLAPRLKAAA